MCPEEDIANCKQQDGSVCNQCDKGFVLEDNKCEVKKDCGKYKELSPEGECVKPSKNCTEGQTSYINKWKTKCLLCKPGYELVTKNGTCKNLPNPQNCIEINYTNPKRLCSVCKDG